MRAFSIIAVLMLLSSNAQAEAGPPAATFNMSFMDSTTGEPLENLSLTLFFEGRESGLNSGRTGQGGTVVLALAYENISFRPQLDDDGTPLIDYPGISLPAKIRDGKTFTIFLKPAGAIRGRLLTESGKPLSGFAVRSKCIFEGTKQTSTDETGTFEFKNVPVGDCMVSTVYEGKFRSVLINVTSGRYTRGDIKIEPRGLDYYELGRAGAAFLFLALLAFFLFSFINLRKELRDKNKGEDDEIVVVDLSDKTAQELWQPRERVDVTKRMGDIMQTLPERQSKIVQLLIDNKGLLVSAELWHVLGMAKATMSRDLNSLESKKIVDTVHVGRNRKVRLTNWFLFGDANTPQ